MPEFEGFKPQPDDFIGAQNLPLDFLDKLWAKLDGKIYPKTKKNMHRIIQQLNHAYATKMLSCIPEKIMTVDLMLIFMFIIKYYFHLFSIIVKGFAAK